MTVLLAPTTLGLEPSFGFGDRLGCATPGHLAALREAGGSVRGVFAQQSIREMTRTSRSPGDVMGAATNALAADAFDEPWSADADHLKTPDDVRRTMDAGFVFFTLDPSEHVDQKADGYGDAELAERFQACRDAAPWFDSYLGRTVRLPSGELRFDELTLRRAAVKYGRAIQAAIDLGRFVAAEARAKGRPFEIELSIDETDQPTTYAEHYLIADQMREGGVELISLAPRFVGEFEKGVDYKGDPDRFAESLAVHADIARELGPYKLSLHSGSDKVSIYSALAKATGGCFHVKTAGTSYLEALRVVAQVDPALFARIVEFSRSRYDVDKATYHVSATLGDAPSPSEADAETLERAYLERWADVPEGQGFTAPGRQVLHCTFGSVVTDPTLGAELLGVLAGNADLYKEVLRDHFTRHLRPLAAG